jgi:two-component system phosphate regulon sensor histidine kinase PhoR
VFEPRPGEDLTEHPWYERLVPGSLRLRLILPFVVIVATVLLVLALFLGERARDIYVTRLESELETQARTIIDVVGLAGDDGAPVDLAGVVGRLPETGDHRVTLIAEDGTVLADTTADDLAALENHNGREEVREARERGSGGAQRRSATTGVSYLYEAIALDDGTGRVLRVAVPLDEVDAVVDRLQRYLIITALVALALVTAIATFIGVRLVEPLEELRVLAKRVEQGDLAGQASPSAVTEIDAVGHAFNMMTHALRTSLDDLDRARTRLEAVLAGLEDGVVLTDIHGEVLRMNRAAERMLASTEARAIERPFIQVARDHELDDQLQRALRGQRAEPRVVEHGLNRRQLQVSGTTVRGKSERLGLVVLRDVTDLRRLEGVRREFVANVSHELRTPLTSIRALVETLESGAVDDPVMEREFLGRIVQEVDRLTTLVEDLMDLARLESGRGVVRLEEAGPSELLRTAGERLREQVQRAGLDLTYALPDALPEVLVERRRIEQVVINLVHNAIKFTPPGGTITITARQEGERVAVEVRDTGAGIAADEIERLFERFYKSDKARRSDGTGLGLAIAKHIVQAHRGEISVRSEPGRGAAFTFTLPVATSRAAMALRDQQDASAPS